MQHLMQHLRDARRRQHRVGTPARVRGLPAPAWLPVTQARRHVSCRSGTLPRLPSIPVGSRLAACAGLFCSWFSCAFEQRIKKTRACTDNFPTRAAGSFAFMLRASGDALPVGSILLAALPIHSHREPLSEAGDQVIDSGFLSLDLRPWQGCGACLQVHFERVPVLERSVRFHASRRPKFWSWLGLPTRWSGSLRCKATRSTAAFQVIVCAGSAPTPPPLLPRGDLPLAQGCNHVKSTPAPLDRSFHFCRRGLEEAKQ